MSGIVEWAVALVLIALLAIVVVIVLRTIILPWYRNRQMANNAKVISGGPVEDDISIILSGTVTQKDLQNTIKLLKEVSVIVKRTEQKAAALEKIKQYQTKIEEENNKIQRLITEIKPASQQP